MWLTADGVAGARPRRRGRRPPPAPPDRRRCAGAQLPAHIPTLAELFDTCGTDYHLSLDLKDAEAGAAVIRTRPGGRPRRCSPGSGCATPTGGSWPRCGPLDPDVKLVDSTRLAKIKEGPERRAALLAEAGVDAVNLHHTDWTGGLTTLFHRFGRYTLAWDLQYEHVLRDRAAHGHRRRLQRLGRPDERRLRRRGPGLMARP